MTFIQTYSGKTFRPFLPDVQAIDIDDIAHSLGMLCRFNGHCSRFYSVAEHSVNVSLIVPDEYALQALLHDAAEAYISDIPHPIKVAIPEFIEAEKRIFDVIAEKFGVDNEISNPVHKADKIMLAMEQQQIMSPPQEKWHDMPEQRDDMQLKCLSPENAKTLFLNRFEELVC